jgi:CheY-like chemotaxis protein
VEVTACSSGRDAVEAARNADFDLVFIDHMMPEMDGLETSRALRGLGGRFKNVPFVALTANAMAGMREMFLSSGFNDFLSKPIEMKKLDEILEKWIPRERRQEIGPENAGSAGKPSGLDIDGLDSEAGLKRIGGSRKDYLESLDIYCRDMEARLPLLEPGSEKDIARLASNIHAVKGASANLGASDLAGEAARLEKICRRGDFPSLLRELPEFRGRLSGLTERIRKALLSVLAETEAAEKEIDLPAGPLLALKAALAARNVGEADRILAELSESAGGGAAAKSLERISTRVLLSDFREAEEAVEIWLKGNRP